MLCMCVFFSGDSSSSALHYSQQNSMRAVATSNSRHSTAMEEVTRDTIWYDSITRPPSYQTMLLTWTALLCSEDRSLTAPTYKAGYLLKRGGARRWAMSTCCRSEEHTSELQSLMRISYDVSCLKKTNHKQ